MNISSPFKIGIYRALYLGDMLCVIPAVRAIRRAYPDGKITLISLPWAKEFARRFSLYFDDFIEFPGWPGMPEREGKPEAILKFLSYMQAQEFDLILQMQGNGEISNAMCKLWNPRSIAGLRRKNQWAPDESLFPVSEDDDHEILRFLKVTDALGIPRQGTQLEFPFLSEEEELFSKYKRGWNLPDEYVCIHPGARDIRRRWPVSKFAKVANALALKGKPIVLTGSRSEFETLHELEGRISGRVINAVKPHEELPLGVLARLIGNAALLISNDTGVSHIASALKVPSVIVFSPYSDLRRWAPLNPVIHRIVAPEDALYAEHAIQLAIEQLETTTSTVLLDQEGANHQRIEW